MAVSGSEIVSGNSVATAPGEMIVVTIISFLAMMAVPVFRRIENKARATAMGDDLRVFGNAFEAYASEKGGFPAATNPGVYPPEMAGRIKESDWTRASPLGGHFAFETNQDFAGVRYSAVITVSTTSDSALTGNADQLEELDKMVDDGNLNTGNLFYGGSGSLVWIVER